MSTEKNLELVKELLDAMRAHDIRKGTSYYAEDSVLDMIPVEGVVRGPQGLAAAWGMAWTAFPDQYYREDNLFAYGDYVCFEGVMGGTQQGTYLGLPPTGKHMSVRVCFVWRIEEGKGEGVALLLGRSGPAPADGDNPPEYEPTHRGVEARMGRAPQLSEA